MDDNGLINICGLNPPAKCSRVQIYYNVYFAESTECKKCEYLEHARLNILEVKYVLSNKRV